VIAVDALEKLVSSTRARWIPKTIPAQVRVVISGLPCEDFAALERRNPGMIAARPFTREVARTYLIETLARRSRRLPSSEVERIIAHPRAVLPIFMKTLVEELSVFGSHEGLPPRITECLAAQEPDDLFEVILARLERELGVDAVRKPLEALGVVYWGLSEDELLDFTGVQPLRWSQLRVALDDALIETSGVVRLSHAYMQKCVADRYFPQEADRHARRRDFGLWSEAREPSPRSAWGMSFGFIVPCAAADLEKCLLNPRTGLALLEYRPRDEVTWHYVQAAKFHGEVNAGRWMARAIEPRWDAWRAAIAGRPDHGGSAWSGLLNLLLRLRSTGDFSMQITDEAITWAESRFEAVSPSAGPGREARVLVLLHRLAGDVCWLNSARAKARGHYERAVAVARSIASAHPTDESRMVVALALEELASCLDSTEEWHATIRAALAEHRSVVTKDHLQASMSQQARLLTLLARHEAYADRNDEAAALAAESIRLARKCVEEFGDPFSLIELSKSLHTVAGLEFVRGRSDKAQQLLDEGIKATERALSASWSSAGLVNLAGLQSTASTIEGARGNKDASRRLAEEALSIVRRLASYTEAEGAQHQLISALRDAGQQHRERRDYKEAAAVHGEMVEAYRRVIRIADSDEHRSGLAWGLLAYGMDQWWAGDLRGAAASLSEASELADVVGRGAESGVDYRLKSYAAGCLAQLHERRGRIDAALRAFEEALHAARAWGIDAKQAQLGSLEAGALRMRIAVEKRDRKAIVGATSCVIAVVVLAAVVAGVHDGWKGATIVSLIGISPLAILPQFGLIELVGLLVLCLGAVGARYGVAPALISALPAAVWLLWMWRSKRSPAPA
jgi:tetratricopeptide (TPR) repeat protein